MREKQNTTRKTVDFSKIYVDTILWISKYVFSKGEGDESRADKDLFYGNMKRYPFTAKEIKMTLTLISDSSNEGEIWECECDAFEDNQTCWHKSELLDGDKQKDWLLSALYRWFSRTKFIQTIISHPDDSELIMASPMELRQRNMIHSMENMENGIDTLKEKLKDAKKSK